jgi:hypothetical protein
MVSHFAVAKAHGARKVMGQTSIMEDLVQYNSAGSTSPDK